MSRAIMSAVTATVKREADKCPTSASGLRFVIQRALITATFLLRGHSAMRHSTDCCRRTSKQRKPNDGLNNGFKRFLSTMSNWPKELRPQRYFCDVLSLGSTSVSNYTGSFWTNQHLFLYLCKINDRGTRGPPELSEIHDNT